MRTAILLIMALFSLNITSAQVNNQMNAFGLRVGDNSGLVLELNYQRYLNDSRSFRLESGFGFKDRQQNEVKHLKWVNTFQHVRNLFGRYNWYVGLGAGFGNYETDLQKKTEFLAAAVIGIGWSSKIPLNFSIDLRPEYRPNSVFGDDLDFDIGLSLRFQF